MKGYVSWARQNCKITLMGSIALLLHLFFTQLCGSVEAIGTDGAKCDGNQQSQLSSLNVHTGLDRNRDDWPELV